MCNMNNLMLDSSYIFPFLFFFFFFCLRLRLTFFESEDGIEVALYEVVRQQK